ncbi:hypothetical protein B0H13DRAFT_151209 [Mycena leptocephala]|nr:hypothetical protein B0H13DRAFT_151209 [Mycena leptocephala]
MRLACDASAAPPLCMVQAHRWQLAPPLSRRDSGAIPTGSVEGPCLASRAVSVHRLHRAKTRRPLHRNESRLRRCPTSPPRISVHARPSGSPMQPAHANSPFSDDPRYAIAFPPVSQRRSVRSFISMTSISILSPRPTRHRAFNAWHGAPAAPARALPLDTANVPSRVAVNSSSPAHIFVHRGRDVRVSACKAYTP